MLQTLRGKQKYQVTNVGIGGGGGWGLVAGVQIGKATGVGYRALNLHLCLMLLNYVH